MNAIIAEQILREYRISLIFSIAGSIAAIALIVPVHLGATAVLLP